WGAGRPGWHIECSAMSEKELGADFAVHGGGIDLVFAHHENEIAQTEAARGVPLAEIWMHNGLVEIDEEKMSKSVGNIFQLSEAVERYGGQTVVAYLASGHYRRPLAFSDEQLQEAAARVERIRNYVRDAPSGVPDEFLGDRRQAFLDALADDFNTPQAFAVLFEIVAEGNRRELPGAREVLAELLPLLGLESLLEGERGVPEEAQRLLAEREEARAAKDFGRADSLREQLAEMGGEVRDEGGGPPLWPRHPPRPGPPSPSRPAARAGNRRDRSPSPPGPPLARRAAVAPPQGHPARPRAATRARAAAAARRAPRARPAAPAGCPRRRSRRAPRTPAAC